jgi:hypothetical protein
MSENVIDSVKTPEPAAAKRERERKAKKTKPATKSSRAKKPAVGRADFVAH